MKKVKKFLTSTVLAFQVLSLTAGAATIESVQLDTRNVTVRGTSDESVVSYKVHSKDSDGIQIADVCEMGEAKVNDGEFVINITMPEYFKGVETDGEFVVTVKGAEPAEFTYIAYSSQEEFVEEVNGITQGADLVTLLESTSDAGYANLSIMKILGADVDYYNSLGDETVSFANIFVAENAEADATAETFSTIFERAKTVQQINKNKATLEWLDETDFEFENEKFEDLTDTKLRNWILDNINSVITDTSKYGSYSDIEDKYYEANVLYVLNNVKYTEYDDKISLYDDVIEIMEEDFYEDYLKMKQSHQNSVNSKVKNYISKTPANNAEEFRDIYEKAVKEVKKSMNSGSGSGSGSSSSSSGGGMSIIAPEKSNPTKEQAGFSDLGSVDWAKDAIDKLSKNGVVAGYDDNTFKPQKNITREEFVKMVVAAQGIRLNASPCGLADVDQNAWYAPYVNAAYQAGIVKGVSENEFGIGKEITREDMAVIIARLKNYAGAQEAQNAFADEASISAYAKDAVYSLYNAGKIAGIGDNMFGPKQIVTRAQAAKVIYDTLFAGIL